VTEIDQFFLNNLSRLKKSAHHTLRDNTLSERKCTKIE